jgi:hypothetical protein
LYELVWFYIMGKPEGAACEVTEAEAMTLHTAVRKLTGGVSGGVSGGTSGGESSDSSTDGSASKGVGQVSGAPSQHTAGSVLVVGLGLAAASSLM